MERTITLEYAAPIPVGHRIEVSELALVKASGSSFAITDLDSGIRYHPEGAVVTTSWHGRVLACSIAPAARAVRTTLVVSVGQPGPASDEAREALSGADAALAAAKAEAERWSSSPWSLPGR